MRALWKQIRSHPYGATLAIYLFAAVITGAVCVAFAQGFDFCLAHRIDFASFGKWTWLITPIAITGAVFLIRTKAPFAAGTGIPQAIFCAEYLEEKNERTLFPLFSFQTLIIKIIALYIGIGVGASTGREGPTVHVAICIFMAVLLICRKRLGISVNLRAGAVAGAAAGLAAAFNTPLAGVTFAVEELSQHRFPGMKDYVLMAIIAAGLMARSLTGEYAYFGLLPNPPSVSLRLVLGIGLGIGLCGALFGKILLDVSQRLRTSNIPWWAISLSMGTALLGSAVIGGLQVLGPGNHVAQTLLEGTIPGKLILFSLFKILSTWFTYWSGIAGGIFAPCLSIGASLGSSMGSFFGDPTTSCALLGMAAFLSGCIQAPMTSFVIIFEMTGHHDMLLPLMLVSCVAFMASRLIGISSLYQSLAEQYKTLID